MQNFETSGGKKAQPVNNVHDGCARVSEEAVAAVAMQAIKEFDGVKPAIPGFITGLRLGRKTVRGVRVNVAYDEDVPEIIVDAYVSVRYGLRLPDVCWDLQEAMKRKLETTTGYVIKAVNVYVHSIDFIRSEKFVSKEKAEPKVSAE